MTRMRRIVDTRVSGYEKANTVVKLLAPTVCRDHLTSTCQHSVYNYTMYNASGHSDTGPGTYNNSNKTSST